MKQLLQWTFALAIALSVSACPAPTPVVPTPSASPDGLVSAAYAATLLSPAQGLVAQVTNGQVRYSADDAQVRLEAGPGASATVINLLSVTYVYTDPYGEEAALAPVEHPIAPVAVPAGSPQGAASATVTVPLANSSLSDLFLGPNPPSQAIARVQFITSAGDTLQDRSQSDLTLNVPINRQ
ncbi:MAG TPA: hypothetical protein V6D47_14155 [Oscillatoriaceae cyanobacterium]